MAFVPSREAPGRPLGTVFSTRLHQLAREALVERFRSEVAETGVLLFAGGRDPMRHDTDHEDIFRQESTFHYLFGVREPGYLGCIDVESGNATIFAPRLPQEYELWMGKILDADDIQEHYGVEEVVYVDEMASWFEGRAPSAVYVQRGRNSDSGTEVQPASFEGLDQYQVNEEALHTVVYETRARKNEEEIRLLRYVNRISSDAHIAMMRGARPGLMEYQLESTFAYGCHYNGGARLLSYTPIAGSGPNSAVGSPSNGVWRSLGHAGAPNDRKLEDGDIVLCDMGCELYCYASDITNSFPANGQFSADQKVIFETVAAMQAAVLSAMKPKVAWADMHELAYRVMCERLEAAGLLVGDVDEMMKANVGGVLMPHGLGHFMGIDTHDVGGYPKGSQRDGRDGFKALRVQRVLEPGFLGSNFGDQRYQRPAWAMCNASCCNDFASSPKMQLFYVAAPAVYAITFITAFVVAMAHSEEERDPIDFEALQAATFLVLVGVFVTWIMILVSRCCLPCCYREMASSTVPPPCPCGPCSCQNLVLLDYPLMIAFGGEVFSFAIDLLFAFIFVGTVFTEGHRDSRGKVAAIRVTRILRLLRLVWVALAIIAVGTGLRKFQLLHQQARSMAVPAQVPGAVVGTPIGTTAPTDGKVLTVEPGVYFMDYALKKAKEDPELGSFFNWQRLKDFEGFGGIRLEDNVLVTEDGIENFTVAPRTVDEVEAVMRGEIADSVALIAWRDERQEQGQLEEEYA
eukprot:s168_g13.t1